MKLISLDTRVEEEEIILRKNQIREFSREISLNIEKQSSKEIPKEIISFQTPINKDYNRVAYTSAFMMLAIEYAKTAVNPTHIYTRARRDFTVHVPEKRMQMMKLPPGFYGFTYLGHDFMAINDNLSPERNYETQVHEAIHTPDEYETRAITAWMLQEKDDDPYLLNQENNYSKAA